MHCVSYQLIKRLLLVPFFILFSIVVFKPFWSYGFVPLFFDSSASLSTRKFWFLPSIDNVTLFLSAFPPPLASSNSDKLFLSSPLVVSSVPAFQNGMKFRTDNVAFASLSSSFASAADGNSLSETTMQSQSQTPAPVSAVVVTSSSASASASLSSFSSSSYSSSSFASTVSLPSSSSSPVSFATHRRSHAHHRHISSAPRHSVLSWHAAGRICSEELCVMDLWRDLPDPSVVFFVYYGSSAVISCKFRYGHEHSASTHSTLRHNTEQGAFFRSCVIPPQFQNYTEGLTITIGRHFRNVSIPPPSPGSPYDSQQAPPLTLSAVIMFRIFQKDLFHITFLELQEWMEWMFHAGVQHIYMYDNFRADDESESHEAFLAPYVRRGLVTYHSWPFRPFAGYPFAQQSAYMHCLYRYRVDSIWQVQCDVDEYPYVFGDTAAGYLRRLIDSYSATFSQIRLQPCFFGGPHPIFLNATEDDSPRDEQCIHACNKRRRCSDSFLIERYRYRETPTESGFDNTRGKPIYKLQELSRVDVHWGTTSGATTDVPFQRAWMLHYWGFRCGQACGVYDPRPQALVAPVLRARLIEKDCDSDFV